MNKACNYATALSNTFAWGTEDGQASVKLWPESCTIARLVIRHDHAQNQ